MHLDLWEISHSNSNHNRTTSVVEQACLVDLAWEEHSLLSSSRNYSTGFRIKTIWERRKFNSNKQLNNPNLRYGTMDQRKGFSTYQAVAWLQTNNNKLNRKLRQLLTYLILEPLTRSSLITKTWMTSGLAVQHRNQISWTKVETTWPLAVEVVDSSPHLTHQCCWVQWTCSRINSNSSKWLSCSNNAWWWCSSRWTCRTKEALVVLWEWIKWGCSKIWTQGSATKWEEAWGRCRITWVEAWEIKCMEVGKWVYNNNSKCKVDSTRWTLNNRCKAVWEVKDNSIWVVCRDKIIRTQDLALWNENHLIIPKYLI